MSWQECVDCAKSYAEEEIASLLGVDLHSVRCAMQVGTVRSTLRGDKWHATGLDLLEWGSAVILYDEALALFAPPMPEKMAQPAQPVPASVEETKAPRSPVIYFAACGGHVKIGFTRGKPERRLKGLATANPIPVEQGTCESHSGRRSCWRSIRRHKRNGAE